MRKPLPLVVCAVMISSVLAIGGCPPPAEPPTNDSISLLGPPGLVVAPGLLKVNIGLDRVAAPGEVFWLPAEVGGGTAPYAYAWTACSVASGCDKPLILGGDTQSPCITVYGTCRLRVTVTDSNGAMAVADVRVTVPE